jgi:hypothetical protein
MWLMMVLIAILAFAGTMSCGDDDDDDDDDATEDDDDAVDDDDDATDDDDDATDDDDDDATGPVWEGSEIVFVDTPQGEVQVSLAGLPAFEWTDPEDELTKQAIYVKTVIDKGIENLALDPAGLKIGFTAADGYSPLSQKYDGDFRQLPAYGDMDKGWFIQYEQEPEKWTDIQVIWDESLNLPNFMGVKQMNGGQINMVEEILFDETVTIQVNFADEVVKAAVDLNGLPAFYDEDEDLCVYTHHIVLEAALEAFDPETYTYVFDFIADNGWSLLADGLGDDQGLLPGWLAEDDKDIHHGWIKNTEEDGFRLFWDDATGYDAETYGVKNMEDGDIIIYTVVE